MASKHVTESLSFSEVTEKKSDHEPLKPYIDSALQMENGKPVHIEMPILGVLTGFNLAGQPLVSHEYSEYDDMIAMSTTKLELDDINKKVTLVFIKGDVKQPMILGVVQDQVLEINTPKTIECAEGILLKCGDAKISLDKDGHLLIQGVTVSTQAYGTNRVKGSAVKIN